MQRRVSAVFKQRCGSDHPVLDVPEWWILPERRDVEFIGAKLYYPDDTLLHLAALSSESAGLQATSRAGRRTDEWIFRKTDCRLPDISAVTGACMMVKRKRI